MGLQLAQLLGDLARLRLQCPDLQEDRIDLLPIYSEMDSFAQEDRAWNPFLVDFYLPKWHRDQFLEAR